MLFKTSQSPTDDQFLNWYAVKVFFNRTDSICEKLKSEQTEFFRQNIMPSYLFIHCSPERILEIKDKYWGRMFIYYDAEKKAPYKIPEQEMASFILVTSNDFNEILFLGEDKAEYHSGEKVRIVDGPFKGAEGFIKRIKRDRKLVVSINGVAAVAIANIHSRLVEKVS